MVPSSLLLELLRRFEGLGRMGQDGLVHPYICPAGFPTQGYGHLVKDMSVPAITVAEAEEVLASDAGIHLDAAVGMSPGLRAESDARQTAIGSFVFNLGPGRYRASTLRRRVDEGDWDGAAEQCRKWVFGGGKKLPGLVIRRELEALLLQRGSNPQEES